MRACVCACVLADSANAWLLLQEEHEAQRKDTEASVNNATQVLAAELQRKEDEVFEIQQKMRQVEDETQQLRAQAKQVATQTTARCGIAPTQASARRDGG